MPDDSMRTRTATASGEFVGATREFELDIDIDVDEAYIRTTTASSATVLWSTDTECTKQMGVGRRVQSGKLDVIIGSPSDFLIELE